MLRTLEYIWASLEGSMDISWLEYMPENLQIRWRRAFGSRWALRRLRWGFGGAWAGCIRTLWVLEGEDDILEMVPEFGIFKESISPHWCDFFRWISKPRTKAKSSDDEVAIAVVDGDSEYRADLVSHDLLFLLERVFLSWSIQFWPLNWTNWDDRNSWRI